MDVLQAKAPSHPRLWLAATVGCCFLAGLSLARLSLDEDRVRLEQQRAAPSEPDPVPAATDETPLETVTEPATGTPAPDLGPQREAETLDAVESQGMPADNETPIGTGSRRMVAGRTAYLRCKGLQQRAGPIPCPRDRALEQAAWELVRLFQSCEDIASNREMDLRVRFAGSGPGQISLRERGSALPQPLERCLRSDARLETRLTPEDMVVSFYFKFVSAETHIRR